MKYYLYILESATANKYYVGISNDPNRRLTFHNSIETGFTSRYRPWELVFTKAFATKIEALSAERKIKRWKNKVMTKRVITGEIQL